MYLRSHYLEESRLMLGKVYSNGDEDIDARESEAKL